MATDLLPMEKPPDPLDPPDPDPLDPQCANCQFFRARGQGAGLCRRHPPQANGRIGPSSWPYTRATDWCGEYAAVPVPPPVSARLSAAPPEPAPLPEPTPVVTEIAEALDPQP